MPKINQEEYELLKGLDDRWKWIARDKSGKLYIYDKKPKKISIQWFFGRGSYLSLGNETFQFIQWEDEEAYSIQELIEGYESDGTEARKDIEWLKEKVLELQNNGNPEANQTEAEREIGRLQKWAWDNCVDRVYELINQLDEPETKKLLSEHAKNQPRKDGRFSKE